MQYRNLESRRLRLSAMAFAIGATTPVFAQTTPDDAAARSSASTATATKAWDDQKTNGDAVQRVGGVEIHRQRARTTAAVARKQSEERVMDALTKEQIESLPDATVTDTVKRVAGVSTSFNSDNVNGRDEAQFISIRGLDGSYNNVNIDGAPMASTDQTSRSGRTNMLPSSLVKEVRVYKTWLPDQDPNAVGGSIDIVTRSAFDNGGKPFFNVNGALGHAGGTGKVLSASEGLGRKTDMVFSTAFGPTQALGLVVAANYEKYSTTSIGQMTTDNIFYNYYNANGSIANPAGSGGPNFGNGRPVPQQFKYWQFLKNFERQGVDLKLEARFNANLYGFIGLAYNNETTRQIRNETFIDDSRSTGTNPVLNQTTTSGRFALGEAEAGNMYSKINRTLQSVQGGLDWKLGDERTLSFRSSFSDATQREPRQMAKYIYARFRYNPAGTAPTLSGTPGLGMSYDTSGFLPSISVNPANFDNLANWRPDYWRTENIAIDDRVADLKLDFRQNMDTDSRGFGYALGVDYRRLAHSYTDTLTQYNPTSDGMTLVGAGHISGTLMPNTNGLPFIIVDPAGAWGQFAANRNIVAANSSNLASSLQNNYSHTEDITDGYAMAAYRTDRLSATFGLRQDNARLSTTGNVRNVVNGATTWQSVTSDSHYGFTLPAAALIFDATRDVRLKLAASQTIGRPNFDAYAPNTSISENTDGSITVTQGNPGIKPRHSDNLDASAEWYLPNSGLASVAAFHKRIRNEIFTLQSQGQMFFDGANRVASITQPMNASSSQLNGLEFNLVQGSFGWISPYLKGVGFGSNLTLLAGRLGVKTASGGTRSIDRLVNQPDRIFNFTLFYTYQRFSASAAYNWVGDSLRTVDSSLPSQDVYWQARKQIDLQARYDLGRGWQASFSVANLTNSPLVSATGPNRNLLKDRFSLNRMYWLGLSYTPKKL
ncbi:TonB-dependent receptor [Paraburkholderia caledonica]|uniref:TonB-dependent receptor n=1 Tax=Paraburkholderia caledonica TaxID=134536 RepID=A0AB73INI6_9BURK|nr:TonB-dependent receptor [Paraburkholderia caledonica]